MRRLPYELIWGFRCSRLTAFHLLLETASTIFIPLLIHLILLFATIRDYSSLFAVFGRYSGFFTGQRRQIGFNPSFRFKLSSISHGEIVYNNTFRKLAAGVCLSFKFEHIFKKKMFIVDLKEKNSIIYTRRSAALC